MIARILSFLILICWSGLAWATFPVNGVLDSFIRANNSTLGSNWTVSSTTNFGSDPSGIISNAAYDTSVSTGSSNVWNVSSFSGTLEEYVTFSVSGSGGLIFTTSTSAASLSGYYIWYSGGTIAVYSMNGSGDSQILNISQTISSGDSLGATITSAGLITIYYEPSGGGWSSVGTVTDTTYSCSYLGILLKGGAFREINFGGGSESSTPAVTNANGDISFNSCVLNSAVLN